MTVGGKEHARAIPCAGEIDGRAVRDAQTASVVGSGHPAEKVGVLNIDHSVGAADRGGHVRVHPAADIAVCCRIPSFIIAAQALLIPGLGRIADDIGGAAGNRQLRGIGIAVHVQNTAPHVDGGIPVVVENGNLTALRHRKLAAFNVQRAAQIHTPGNVHRAAGLGNRGLGGSLQSFRQALIRIKLGNAHSQVGVLGHIQLAAGDPHVCGAQHAVLVLRHIDGRAVQVQRTIIAIGADKRGLARLTSRHVNFAAVQIERGREKLGMIAQRDRAAVQRERAAYRAQHGSVSPLVAGSFARHSGDFDRAAVYGHVLHLHLAVDCQF